MLCCLQIVKWRRLYARQKKANLMEQGYVRTELLVYKSWTDVEVLKYFEDCFKEKLGSLSDTVNTPRYKISM